MEKILKRRHKGLYIIEASWIYCNRHNLNYDTFIDEVFLSGDFKTDGDCEFARICDDLRWYRGKNGNYTLKEITEKEYEFCVDFFD